MDPLDFGIMMGMKQIHVMLSGPHGSYLSFSPNLPSLQMDFAHFKYRCKDCKTIFSREIQFSWLSFCGFFHMAAFLSHDDDDDILNRDDGGDINCDVGHDDDDD